VISTVPLFPLSTVLMPGASLPLHIFEPRYRQLTIDLVTGAVPDRQFGVVALREGFSPDQDGLGGLHAVGCTAELREAQRLPDGRFDIITRGVRRFRLVDLHVDTAPYLVGSVSWLPDTEDDETSVHHLAFLAGTARAAHRRYCSTAWQGEEWDEPAKDIPPAVLPHLLAADCLLPIVCRQKLLEQTCATERLRMVRRMLIRETALLGELNAVPAPITSYAVERSSSN